MTARRTFLALGSAAIAAPSLPALATLPRAGRVETMFREAQVLWDKSATLEAAHENDPRTNAEKGDLFAAIEDADETRGKLLDAAMLTPPETATDALLIIAAVAYEGGLAADNDLTEYGAQRFLAIAKAGRGAAQFLAARLGCDLSPVLGEAFEMPEDVA